MGTELLDSFGRLGRTGSSAGDCCDRGSVERLWADRSPPLRLIWTDPPYGVSYGEKTNWVNEHSGGPGPTSDRERFAQTARAPEVVCDRSWYSPENTRFPVP